MDWAIRRPIADLARAAAVMLAHDEAGGTGPCKCAAFGA